MKSVSAVAFHVALFKDLSISYFTIICLQRIVRVCELTQLARKQRQISLPLKHSY